MCGIAATYAYASGSPPVDRDELRAVRDHMLARGPDGAGEWHSADGHVGLAHRRLAIIDLSDGGAQPMASGDGTKVITFNGEIYNFRELRSALQRRGRVFRSDSDTEVLLQLYEEHGTGMLTMLRGMFAFALWDGRRGAMLLARDAYGIKPLFYADNGRCLRVASQVKALLQARDIDTSAQPAGHASFLLWGSVAAPWTLYRGIRSLPPGHFMWANAQGVEAPQAFLRICDVFGEAAAQRRQGTQQECLDSIAHSLRDTVRAHLVSDVPVGVFLSSGLDSTLLASLMAGMGARPRTLTLGFDDYLGTPNDETPLAEAVAAGLGAEHSTVTIARADFADERKKLLAAMDQPSIDGVNTWFVARAAAMQGLKVALSGIGGDELFASYPSFSQVPRLAALAAPLAAIPGLGLAVRHLSAPLLGRLTSPKYAGLLEYGGTLGGAYLLRRGLFMPWELPQVMDPDMAREGWRDLQALAALDAAAGPAVAHGSSRLAVSALESATYMRQQLLADADWAGMAHSLEIRVPLVDLALTRAAAPWLAAQPSLTKAAIARQAAPALPSALLARTKTGFNVPMRDWLGAATSAPRGLRGWARYLLARQCDAPARSPRKPRVLVSTLAPSAGGVNAMTQFAVRALSAQGLEPVIAHYATYSHAPSLSVPSFKLLQRVPGRQRGQAYGGREAHAIGAWLPELEFTHYVPTKHWRDVMDSCDAWIAVSGSVLAAAPFHATGRPYLAWVATDWEGDRRDRVRRFPWLRRVLDTCVTTPVTRRLERRLLGGGHILPLSDYTAAALARIAGALPAHGVLPVPIDAELFHPKPQARVPGRIGFAGRFNDPRKNIGLLLEAVALLRDRGEAVSVVLMGASPELHVTRQVEALGLGDRVQFRGGLSRDDMRDCLQTLDVFVLPSHQEGLCIAALEAMACGVPVVSTRCGGPEEFVIDRVTGLLVDARPEPMSQAIAAILADEGVRARMSDAARAMVERRYTERAAAAAFLRELHAVFPAIGPAIDGVPA